MKPNAEQDRLLGARVRALVESGGSLDDTDILLRKAGMPDQHPDKLSRAIDDRREAAMKWLAEHPEVVAWCAIDDMPLWSGHAPRFVKTSAERGISRGDARRAIAVLTAS